MFGHVGDEDWATDYFKKAHEAYSEMEAFGKIDQMNWRDRRSRVR
jgi:hypothetical protein